MTSDFPVLDPSWTAQEEMALLEAVMDCGFGNWQDVANQMCTKTKEECEKHYMKHFINNPLFASTLLNLKHAEEAKTADTAIPFQSTDDPPRPTFDSLLSRDMAGYMPARADFIEEFDNYAEWDLRDIDFVEDDSDILHGNILFQHMFLSIVKCVVTLCWVLGMNKRMNKTRSLPLWDSKLGGVSCCIYLLLCCVFFLIFYCYVNPHTLLPVVVF